MEKEKIFQSEGARKKGVKGGFGIALEKEGEG